MFNHFLNSVNSRAKTITFAAVLIFFSTLISRILGLIRDRLLAARFGAGEELDVYFAAFRIPDFIYGLLVMGGVVAVFLPVFAEYYKKSEKEAWELTNNVLNCFLVLLVILCGILAIFTPWLTNIIAPGFSGEQKSLANDLTRIMFLSPIFFGLSSVLSGVLHYFHRFLAYSIAPILYNLGIIAGILFFLPYFGLWGLAFGVVLGAFLHWLVQVLPAKSSGFKYLFLLNFRYPGLVKIFKLMIPRTIGAAAYYINLIVVTAIASTLATGSIAIFNFANNLQYLPIGLVGVSFTTAVFPILSRNWVEGAKDKFISTFSSAFRQILFFIVPFSVLMFLLKSQIVHLVLGTGEFDWIAIRLTAASLGVFCLGIFAFTFIPFLARVFYSFQDTRTPAFIGIASMLLNVILALILVWVFRFSNTLQSLMVSILKLEGIQNITVIALPLAVSLSGIFQFILLLFFLKKKMGDVRAKEIWLALTIVLLATFFMATAVYFSLNLLADLFDIKTFFGVLVQTSLAGIVGVLTYIVFFVLFFPPRRYFSS